MKPQMIAWACCAICVWFSAQTASAFCKSHPRQYTVFALFALVWALLLTYYTVPPEVQYRELFAAYGGFITVYVGGLLSLEALKGDNTVETVTSIQRIGMWLFVPLAFASIWKIELPGFSFQLPREKSQVVVTTLMDVAGYVSLSYGTWKLCGRRAGIAVTGILVVYITAEWVYTFWSLGQKTPGMPDVLTYMFGALKIVLTVTFSYYVSLTTMIDRERARGIPHWCLRFLMLRNAETHAMPPPSTPITADVV
jgi:hypothetical protein